MKSVTIAIAGTGGKHEYRNVVLAPGTTPADVLHNLKLDGFQLMHPGGGAFGNGDDLYASVTDNQKVYASATSVEAGRWATSGRS